MALGRGGNGIKPENYTCSIVSQGILAEKVFTEAQGSTTLKKSVELKGEFLGVASRAKGHEIIQATYEKEYKDMARNESRTLKVIN